MYYKIKRKFWFERSTLFNHMKFRIYNFGIRVDIFFYRWGSYHFFLHVYDNTFLCLTCMQIFYCMMLFKKKLKEEKERRKMCKGFRYDKRVIIVQTENISQEKKNSICTFLVFSIYVGRKC